VRVVIAHILTPLFYAAFGLILVIFHPVQVLVYYTIGEMAHRRVVYFMNGLLSKTLWILGYRIQFNNAQQLPKDRPLIFVANHNSLHDIPMLYWHLRTYHPIFVSKLSLAKSIPSVSFNLRKSGAALIDRSDRMQSMKEIMRLGQLIHDRCFSAVIFPEGTRKGPALRKFKPGGISALLRKAPDALIVPVAIAGTRNINRAGAYPLNIFLDLEWTVLNPVEHKGKDLEILMDEVRNAIAQRLGLN